MDDVTALNKAKKKALLLIQYSDRTEAEIRERLLKEGYDEDIINSTIIYLKDKSFINDIRYSESFVRRMGTSKSRFQMKVNLIKKGVSPEDIDIAFENMDREHEFMEQDPEEEAVRRYLLKGIRKRDIITPDEKRKLFASVCRKGFPFNKVRKVWELILEEESVRTESDTICEDEIIYDNMNSCENTDDY